jgi:hypothetical protein
MDTVLVFPPHWPPFQIYPSLPLLQGYLRSRGEASRIVDANVQFHNHLLSQDFRARALTRVGRWLEGAQSSRADWQARLAARDQLAAGAHDAGVVFGMRAHHFRWDHGSRQIATRTWDSYLAMISAIYPTVWLNHRDLVVTRLSPDLPSVVRFCEDEEENIFLQYYVAHVAPMLQALRPGIVGIALAGPAQTLPAFTLCLLLRKCLPSTHITLGGPYCSALFGLQSPYEHLIGRYFDSIIEGRGELPLRELIIALRESRAMDSVAALTCRMPDGSLRRGNACTSAPRENRVDFTGIDLGAYFYDDPIPTSLWSTAGVDAERNPTKLNGASGGG